MAPKKKAHVIHSLDLISLEIESLAEYGKSNLKCAQQLA